ncbi:hypothetical protein [Propionispira raffinosivorans]|uniref:hypothetical protein n=1 Tax=Propionispira raffinosivorans TaxID=86959 RepID=UPI0012B651C9|nr:hypothetical protein [Propionispira raffinosivorans]
MNDDPNFPVSYYHANYREYVDLNSCAFIFNNADEYEFAVGYVGVVIGGGSSYHIRHYRQLKDGHSLPQFYNENKNQWIAIPLYHYSEIEMYITSHGYLGYINDYHAYSYYMFKYAYKQLWGVEYSDELNGTTP